MKELGELVAIILIITLVWVAVDYDAAMYWSRKIQQDVRPCQCECTKEKKDD